MNSLSELDLSQNKLVDFEYNTFYDLKNVIQINLGYNKLTMDRWKLLGASPFNKCVKLESLNLTNNLLTMVFEDWRNAMSKLQRLDLSFNELESLTVSTITILITIFDQFTVLYSYFNNMTSNSLYRLQISYSDRSPIQSS